nr:hypothetical protein [Treponema sp.]
MEERKTFSKSLDMNLLSVPESQHSYNSARIVFSGYTYFKSNSQNSRTADTFSLWKTAHDAGKIAPCTWAFHILNHIQEAFYAETQKTLPVGGRAACARIRLVRVGF